MWLNPLTTLGAMSIPFLISNFATILGFVFATYFSVRYTMIFYEGRPKPLSWILIMTGLASFCISEMGQFIIPYIGIQTTSGTMINLIAQNFGVILIAVGSFLLYREVGQ